MQNFDIIAPEIVVLAETFVAFVLLISYGLYRYSTGIRNKLWAVGWIVYAAAAVSSILTPGIGLVPTDSIATSGMLAASVLLLDGATDHRRKGRGILVYILAAFVGFAVVPIGIMVGTTYGIAFTVVGLATTYSCWLSARTFRRDTTSRGLDFWLSYAGFLLWGFSTLLFIPLEMLKLLDFQVLITGTSIIATGVGLQLFFIRSTSESLGSQYQVSQLLGSVLRHDIRNYVGSLSESIEQALARESEREWWLKLASEIMASMTDFVSEMRYLSATVSRVEAEKVSMNLASLLEETSTRVAREYGLEPGQIAIEGENDISIWSCGVVKELLWNIFDNAFKHGSKDLIVRANADRQDKVTLEIIDTAGGISAEIQEFLNNPDSLNAPSAPGIGLGIILIRGLSLLCEIPMAVRCVVNSEGVPGTLFQMSFEYDE